MIECVTVVISAYFFFKCTTSKGHLAEITIFPTNGRTGHCSKSRLHHWDWAKVLLYRWPRLMSSVCASLMFAVSREQTASHRVLSNEDDNSTWNMAGCRYVNHSHLVTGLFISAFICKKINDPIFEEATICLQFLPHLCRIFLAHVNINPLSLHRLYLWLAADMAYEKEMDCRSNMSLSEIVLQYCFWRWAFIRFFQ